MSHPRCQALDSHPPFPWSVASSARPLHCRSSAINPSPLGGWFCGTMVHSTWTARSASSGRLVGKSTRSASWRYPYSRTYPPERPPETPLQRPPPAVPAPTGIRACEQCRRNPCWSQVPSPRTDQDPAGSCAAPVARGALTYSGNSREPLHNRRRVAHEPTSHSC